MNKKILSLDDSDYIKKDQYNKDISNLESEINKKADKSEIPDVSMLETKEEHNKDINNLSIEINRKQDKIVWNEVGTIDQCGQLLYNFKINTKYKIYYNNYDSWNKIISSWEFETGNNFSDEAQVIFSQVTTYSYNNNWAIWMIGLKKNGIWVDYTSGLPTKALPKFIKLEEKQN